MRVLVVIPSVADRQPASACRPRRDYNALCEALRAAGAQVELFDFQAAGVKGDLKLALAARARRQNYDAIYVNAESLGVPLALLSRGDKYRPRLVCVGHRLLTGRKKLFFRVLKAHKNMDRLLVYASTQEAFATTALGIEPERVERIQFHADTRFFYPLPEITPDKHQVCAVGREGRDYATLFTAMEGLTEFTLQLTSASPWSKSVDTSQQRSIPANVTCAKTPYSDEGLRELYARSACVAVPLYATDFQAGITTILEAMAMGRPVIATRTSGLSDVLWHEENCLTVAPGNVKGWQEAIQRLHADPVLAIRLGIRGRRWVEENATLDRWVARVAQGLLEK
ncbi:MAG: glycosyltransferase family 4 protein [Armatimonas sp.]